MDCDRRAYRRYTSRLELDESFFNKMDSMGPWIQLPYPPDIVNIQNRESFWTRRATQTRLRHAQWSSLGNRQSQVKNLNGGNNLCHHVYTSLYRRFRR